MAAIEAIRSVESILQRATRYAEIFGPLPEKDTESQLRELRKKFAYLARIVHSDLAAPENKGVADEVFRHLVDARRAAEKAICAGTYNEPRMKTAESSGGDAGGDFTVLRSAAADYFVELALLRRGDFSELFPARTSSGQKVLIKIATDPTFNPWLEREVEIAARFHRAKDGENLAKIAPYVPEVLDSFYVQEGRVKRKVIVLRFFSEHLSLAEVLLAFPNGLDPRDAAWIFRRVIAQAIAAQMAKVIHGAIVPDHVLVHPLTHEPVHIGWGHAIEDPRNASSRIRHIIGRWRDYYPPEVFAKEIPDQRTDIFMAGKIMIALLGGDVAKNTLPDLPKEVAAVIRKCVEPEPSRRPEDGLETMEALTRAIRNAWGKEYRPLRMPVHK